MFEIKINEKNWMGTKWVSKNWMIFKKLNEFQKIEWVSKNWKEIPLTEWVTKIWMGKNIWFTKKLNDYKKNKWKNEL